MDKNPIMQFVLALKRNASNVTLSLCEKYRKRYNFTAEKQDNGGTNKFNALNELLFDDAVRSLRFRH